MKGAHIQFPGWPNDTLEFGWWDTRDGTALQEVSTLRAGEVCVVHQGCFGDTTVNAHAGHILVPVARGTSEENPFLETESFLLSMSHRMTINQICFLALEESQWLFVRPFCLCPFLWLTAWWGGGCWWREPVCTRKSLGLCSSKQCLWAALSSLWPIYFHSIQPALDLGSQAFYWYLNACPRTWRQTGEDKRKESPKCLFSLCPPWRVGLAADWLIQWLSSLPCSGLWSCEICPTFQA